MEGKLEGSGVEWQQWSECCTRIELKQAICRRKSSSPAEQNSRSGSDQTHQCHHSREVAGEAGEWYSRWNSPMAMANCTPSDLIS